MDAPGTTELSPPTAEIAAVRGFSRFYTQAMGVLHRRLLGTDYSLTEARVLLELATHETLRASDIAATLELDPAYLSRLLKRFAKAGLVNGSPDPDDRRGHRLKLTAAGREAFADLNARSNADVEAKLAHLTAAERARLVSHLRGAQRLIAGPSGLRPAIVLREPEVGDLGWIIHRHGRRYAEEFDWDISFEHIVIGIVAGYLSGPNADRNRCWVADVDGSVVGSIFLEHASDTLAKLRLLYVEPEARGHGLGGRLVDTCIAAARAGGYRRLTLWTMDCLTAARRIYESRGFRTTGEAPVRQFNQDLVSLTYDLDL